MAIKYHRHRNHDECTGINPSSMVACELRGMKQIQKFENKSSSLQNSKSSRPSINQPTQHTNHNNTGQRQREAGFSPWACKVGTAFCMRKATFQQLQMMQTIAVAAIVDSRRRRRRRPVRAAVAPVCGGSSKNDAELLLLLPPAWSWTPFFTP
jgi:hypothetical protein